MASKTARKLRSLFSSGKFSIEMKTALWKTIAHAVATQSLKVKDTCIDMFNFLQYWKIKLPKKKARLGQTALADVKLNWLSMQIR